MIAHMPTGAGKTRSLCGWHRLKNCVIKAADDLTRAWEHLGNRPIMVHRYWGSSSLDLHAMEGGDRCGEGQ